MAKALRETDEGDTVGNPKDILKSLWQDFTQNGSQEDDGFLNLGGNSVSAMQIVNTLNSMFKDVGSILLSALLNNKSLTECCKLLENKRDFLKEEKTQYKRLIENEDYPIQKKVMTKNSKTMIGTQMKGHNNCDLKCYGNKFQLNISWTLNLSKCIDASPTCVAYSE